MSGFNWHQVKLEAHKDLDASKARSAARCVKLASEKQLKFLEGLARKLGSTAKDRLTVRFGTHTGLSSRKLCLAIDEALLEFEASKTAQGAKLNKQKALHDLEQMNAPGSPQRVEIPSTQGVKPLFRGPTRSG